MGLAEQGITGLDTAERRDDDEDTEESFKYRDSQSDDKNDAAPRLSRLTTSQ